MGGGAGRRSGGSRRRGGSPTGGVAGDRTDYGEDLSYVHDAGFGGFAERAAPALLALLERSGLAGGLVVDLGCGSGIWAERLVAAGYRVLGVDASAAMIELARRRVARSPSSEGAAASFVQASLWETELPPCAAVTAIGEPLAYLAAESTAAADTRRLERLFRRVHRALAAGGLLIFDLREPGTAVEPYEISREGDDWAILCRVEEDGRRRLLTRRLTTFRRRGASWRRDREVHRLRLHHGRDVADALRRIGFRTRVVRGWGKLRFAPAQVGFVARKP